MASLFDQALHLTEPDRTSFLERECGSDLELRTGVERLLESAERASGFLDKPLLSDAAPLLHQAAYLINADSGPSATADPSMATTRSPTNSDAAFEIIGPYRLLQRIGEGGMGEVYLAEQTEPIHRQVALKLIKAGLDTKQVVARFEAERQALALMDHPGIAKVYEAGETPRGLPYFAMEFVKGEPITSYCDRHRLSTPERLDLFARVCEAVQHAHQKGVIHRDLKPSNVLVIVVGDKPQPKVIDFGVAKATAQRLTEKTMFTELGVLIGTPEYMSPEQAEMTGLDIDTRTDVYALGVMLYELLTGALPFESKELRQAGYDEIRRRIREVDPPKPSTRVRTRGEHSTEAAKNRQTDPGKLASRLEGDLDWIIMKALEKDRTRRYGTPSDMAADLQRHLRHEPVLAGPPSAAYRSRKFIRRHRFGVAAAGLAVVGLATFGVVMAIQARAIARERDRAERVSGFLVELFKVSDPSEARGNSITAREVLDRGASRIDKELEHEPLVQAQMMLTMGLVYRSLGLSKTAAPLLSRAADLRVRLLGPEHPDTLRARSWQFWTYDAEGRYEEARQFLLPLLESQRRVLGEEHPDTLETINSLGVAYERLERPEEAGRYYQQSLEGRLRVLPKDHPDIIWSMNNLASNLEDRGKLEEAAMQFHSVAEVRRRVLGEDHPNTLKSLVNEARLLGKTGHSAEAEALMRKALEGSRHVLGNEHPATLVTMTELIVVLAGQGKNAEAVALFKETYEIRRRVSGPSAPGTLSLCASMGSLYAGMKMFDEAERLLLETYDAATKSQAEPSTFAVYAAYNLAATFALQGRKPDAIHWAEIALTGDPAEVAFMEKDPDFSNLRDDPEFQKLIARAREKSGQSSP